MSNETIWDGLTHAERMAVIKAVSLEYSNEHPKSICKCGHTGDGTNSDHGGIGGHGICLVEGCGCKQFTWVGWTPEFNSVAAHPTRRIEH